MLKQLQIKGFKTIRDQTIDLGKMNVLIGANGAGKSNFVSFFKMLNSMVRGNLQLHIGQVGGANNLLFYGYTNTSQIKSRLIFENNSGTNGYYMELIYAANDTLIFGHEWNDFAKKGMRPRVIKTLNIFSRNIEEDLRTNHKNGNPDNISTYNAKNINNMNVFTNFGNKESSLTDISLNQTHKNIRSIISQCRYFQFHDTSETAKIKQNCYIEDNQQLRSDGGNLSAFLYMLKETRHPYYKRIILTIRQMLPFFDDFVLERSRLNEKNIMLNWKEKDSDLLFGPHQLSDGSLRMMALVTLLFQPEEFLPEVILIDEPELGLHPYALDTIASLIRHASEYCQVIIATQSADLMDYFEPDEIIITERPDKETVFKRLDAEKIKEWREEYTMSELWKKNVLGGTP
jgi:predicted ATPase